MSSKISKFNREGRSLAFQRRALRAFVCFDRMLSPVLKYLHKKMMSSRIRILRGVDKDLRHYL